jgi:hypothetical protein
MPWYSLLPVLSCVTLLAQPLPPESAPSFIAAPVLVDLAPIFAAAERAAPRVPPGVETWTSLPGPALGGGAYRFNLYREPLHFVMNGNRLALHATVNYWLQVGLRMQGWVQGVASCGVAPESFRRARLGLRAELGLTPDWGLDLKLTPEDPMQMNPCQVTFLGYDITDRVLAGMKDALAKAARGVEQELRDPALLRPRVENAWLEAQQPVELSPGVFLLLNPEQVRLAPLRSEGSVLTLTPEIQVRPTLTLGAPSLPPYRPLPPLDLSPAPIQPGFRLRVQADLSYLEASAQLDRQMTGQRFETDKGVFEVQSVNLRGSAGKVLLELGLKGRIEGRLTLTGRPRFDPGSGTLRLEGLDYTLESRSWITQVGEWLFRSSLRRTLDEKCHWFLDQRFQDLQAQVQQGLNRDLPSGLALSGTIDSFILDEIQVLDDRFSLVAQLDGQVGIAVQAEALGQGSVPVPAPARDVLPPAAVLPPPGPG